MLNKGDTVVLKRDYRGMKKGTELVVVRTHLKSEVVTVSYNGEDVIVGRIDVMRPAPPTPELHARVATQGQSLRDYRERRNPTEGMLTGEVLPIHIGRKG